MTPGTDEADEHARTANERWAALIESGQVEMFGEPTGEAVALAQPDPDWATRFAQVREDIRRALGATAVRIDHIGSTAIPGIAAKPVIDVQVSVPDVEAETTYREQLEGLGWPIRSREPGHRYFRTGRGATPRVQVHVCEVESQWEREHLLLRDYLRSHPEPASAYADLKRGLVVRYGGDRLAYAAAKTPFIRATLEAAEIWAAETGWSVARDQREAS